jgi:hypothetical protein
VKKEGVRENQFSLRHMPLTTSHLPLSFLPLVTCHPVRHSLGVGRSPLVFPYCSPITPLRSWSYVGQADHSFFPLPLSFYYSPLATFSSSPLVPYHWFSVTRHFLLPLACPEPYVVQGHSPALSPTWFTVTRPMGDIGLRSNRHLSSSSYMLPIRQKFQV